MALARAVRIAWLRRLHRLDVNRSRRVATGSRSFRTTDSDVSSAPDLHGQRLPREAGGQRPGV